MANIYKLFVNKQYTNKLFLTSVRISNIPETLPEVKGKILTKK